MGVPHLTHLSRLSASFPPASAPGGRELHEARTFARAEARRLQRSSSARRCCRPLPCTEVRLTGRHRLLPVAAGMQAAPPKLAARGTDGLLPPRSCSLHVCSRSCNRCTRAGNSRFYPEGALLTSSLRIISVLHQKCTWTASQFLLLKQQIIITISGISTEFQELKCTSLEGRLVEAASLSYVCPHRHTGLCWASFQIWFLLQPLHITVVKGRYKEGIVNPHIQMINQSTCLPLEIKHKPGYISQR